jgi:putative cell wall-binding protein
MRRLIAAVAVASILAAGWAPPAVQPASAAAPVDPAASPNGVVVPSLSAGRLHTCTVLNTALVCWGEEYYGATTPPDGTYTDVAAGGYHDCALAVGGSVVCWGSNNYGQATPPGGTLGSLSSGDWHSCAVRDADGAVLCWGSNDENQSTPPAGTYRAVSAGSWHSCAIKSDYTLACWGYADDRIVPPAGTFQAIAAGGYHSCAIRSDGTLACWGYNGDGQSTAPTGTYMAVTSGQQHSCAIKSDYTLACWGNNANGQSTAPTGTYIAVAAGWWHTCAIRSDGEYVCWGTNSKGESTPPFPSVVRYSGTGRFETAADISAHTYPANCYCMAYIAYAYNFPDALAGAAAAGYRPGPVLLVNTTGPINSATAAELTRLAPELIVILGSTKVISADVEAALASYSGNPVVRYSGTSRFETAADISAHTFLADCGCRAYIAYAYNFPDALAGAAAAGYHPGPVLLVSSTGAINSATAAELTRLKPYQIVVLGSTMVISSDVEIALDAYAPGHVIRLSGTSRFETAAAISANSFDADCGCVAYIAYAYNFPDALAGAAAAGTVKGPMLLVNTSGVINPATAAELTRLKPYRIIVLGSEGVISAEVFEALKAYAPAY